MSSERPPNIIAVVLDCVRAKSLPLYGGRRVAHTPNLDRLAREGTVFRKAVAPGNWTIPSHMSIDTGTYPWVHGLRTFQRDERNLPKIAEWLTGRGYDTAVFTEEVHLVGGYGLENGYTDRFGARLGSSDEDRTAVNRVFGHMGFLYSAPVRRMLQNLPRLAIPISAVNFRQEIAFKHEVSNDGLGHRFADWLLQRPADRPFHAFFNFVDAHEPYPQLAPRPVWSSERGFVQLPRFYLLAVPGLAERMPWDVVERAYLDSIERADAKLGVLLDELERTGQRERTMIIVTADHGQSFGEGGNIYHGCGATESVLRVPLVVGLPDGAARIPAVDRWISLCEIPSWMKSVALGQPPYGADGIAPVPFPAHPTPPEPVMAEGGPASDPNRSLDGIGLDHRWNHRLIAAYRQGEKWVWDLVSGALWRWRISEGDADDFRPEVLEGASREETLQTVYQVTRPEDADRYLGDVDRRVRVALGDSRMRSWGYD